MGLLLHVRQHNYRRTLPNMAASIHVTKFAAAERQLRAAIRLFFEEEDELAIHTVASAAYRLLSDLKDDRGMDEAADTHLTSIFYAVRSYKRGTLPKHMTSRPELMAQIAELAAVLPIEADSSIKDVKVSIDAESAQRYWRNRNKTANFLKHADKDPSATLAATDVDNANLLMQCVGAYTDLFKDQLAPEGLVFWLYSCVRDDDLSSIPPKLQPIATRLQEIHHDELRVFCAEYIRALRHRQSAA